MNDEVGTATTLTFACVKCGKAFASANAMRMHVMRVHTRAGRMGAMWKSNNQPIMNKKSREVALAKKRAYNAKRRQRFLDQGLTSAGAVRKRKFNKTAIKARKLAYQRDWYNKNKPRILQRRRELYVYPRPVHKEPETTPEQAMPIRGHINFCPECGANIKRYEMLTTTEE